MFQLVAFELALAPAFVFVALTFVVLAFALARLALAFAAFEFALVLSPPLQPAAARPSAAQATAARTVLLFIPSPVWFVCAKGPHAARPCGAPRGRRPAPTWPCSLRVG